MANRPPPAVVQSRPNAELRGAHSLCREAVSQLPKGVAGRALSLRTPLSSRRSIA